MDINIAIKRMPPLQEPPEKIDRHQPLNALNQGVNDLADGDVSDEKPWLLEPHLKTVNTMEDYLSIKKVEAKIALELAKIEFAAFRKDLEKVKPELASKHFGFSISEEGSFTILDPRNNLSEAETDWLTEQLGQYRCLKGHLVSLLKISTTLAKYDKDNLGARYHLESGKLAKITDFGSVLSSENMAQAWTHQIEQRADRKVPFISEKI